MGNKKKGKILAVLLSGALIGTQMPGMTVAEGAAGYTGGICGHHPVHTAECGYQEAVPEQPCRHEHTKECYEYVTSCVHVHTEECYPLIAIEVPAGDQDTEGTTETQTEWVRGSEPTACIHVCSEDSGCVTKTLNCVHEDKKNADGSMTYAVHDASCGYAPAVEGKECTFVCEICSAQSLSETETEALTVQIGIAAAGSADSEPSAKTTEAGDEGADEDETDSETSTEKTTETGTEGTSAGTDSETEAPAEKTTEAGTEGTSAGETDPETEVFTEKTTETGIEGTEPDTEAAANHGPRKAPGANQETGADEAVSRVQALIDALPSVSEVEKMPLEEQKEVYNDAQDAADVYFDELTEEQQEQVDLTKLMDLMNFFNGQVSTMAEVVATVKIGNTTTNYYSLKEALNAAGARGTTATVTLKQDTTLRGSYEIWGNVTFVGGNYKVTGTFGIGVFNGGTFTVKSGTLDSGGFECLSCSGGTIIVDGGNIEKLWRYGGTITINGGTIGRIQGSAGSLNYSATGLSLDKSKLSLTKDTTGTITATVTHNSMSVNGSTDPIPVEWKSSNTSVVTVSGDKTATVTAVGPGTATITATAGGKTATCTVTVKNVTAISNKGGSDGYQTSFVYGDTIPEPAQSNFNITGSTDGFTCKWYNGNHTTGELPAQTVGKPDAAGTYTLVITTTENTAYGGGELRLLVTVAGAEYHITIPASAEAGGDEVAVSITEGSTFNISSNGKVRVTVSSGAENGTVTLTRQNDGTNPAQVISELRNGKDGSTLKNGGTVALYNASQTLTDDTAGKLYCAAPEAAEGQVIPAGSYEGTVTFQISYEIQ